MLFGANVLSFRGHQRQFFMFCVNLHCIYIGIRHFNSMLNIMLAWSGFFSVVLLKAHRRLMLSLKVPFPALLLERASKQTHILSMLCSCYGLVVEENVPSGASNGYHEAAEWKLMKSLIAFSCTHAQQRCISDLITLELYVNVARRSSRHRCFQPEMQRALGKKVCVCTVIGLVFMGCLILDYVDYNLMLLLGQQC